MLALSPPEWDRGAARDRAMSIAVLATRRRIVHVRLLV